MIKVCGLNSQFQLCEDSNNKDSLNNPVVNPPCNFKIDISSIFSISFYYFQTVWITTDKRAFAIGSNMKYQISENLPQDTFQSEREVIYKNEEGRQYEFISVVCGESYTLYRVSLESDKKSRLVYQYEDHPKSVFLNLNGREPLALFGGDTNSAIIDSEGAIIVITKSIFNNPKKILEPSFLPNNEKAVSVACCNKFILALSAVGHVYESTLESDTIQFNKVDELFDKKISQISGTFEHCFAVSKDGHVFGRGSNKYGQLALGKSFENAEKFTEIASLSKYEIKFASAGLMHSLFMTSDGKILACGNNFIGQLPLSSGLKKKLVFSPHETVISEDATFCVAGGGETAVFIDLQPPLNTPNTKVTKDHRRQSKMKGKSKSKKESKKDEDSKSEAEIKSEDEEKNREVEQKNDNDVSNKKSSDDESNNENEQKSDDDNSNKKSSDNESKKDSSSNSSSDNDDQKSSDNDDQKRSDNDEQRRSDSDDSRKSDSSSSSESESKKSESNKNSSSDNDEQKRSEKESDDESKRKDDSNTDNESKNDSESKRDDDSDSNSNSEKESKNDSESDKEDENNNNQQQQQQQQTNEIEEKSEKESSSSSSSSSDSESKSDDESKKEDDENKEEEPKQQQEPKIEEEEEDVKERTVSSISKNEVDDPKRKIIESLKLENEELRRKINEIERSKSKNESCVSHLDTETIQNLRTIEEISTGKGTKIVEVVKEEKFALKIMNTGKKNKETQPKFLSEQEKLNSFKHPNIIKTYGIHFSADKLSLSILLELCPRDLSTAIKNSDLSNEEIVKYVYQIAEGMKFAHSKGFIHRNLKPSNILISKEGDIKISEFGIPTLMTLEEQSSILSAASQKFMPPEILNEEEYNEKADIYSFGVVLFFMLSGGEMPKITIIQMGNGKKAPIPDTFTDFATDLINKCWEPNPSNRPNFIEILTLLDENDYGIIELSSDEVDDIRQFIAHHKKRIPLY